MRIVVTTEDGTEIELKRDGGVLDVSAFQSGDEYGYTLSLTRTDVAELIAALQLMTR